MAAKEVRFGDEARQRMVAGVNLLANAVKATLDLMEAPSENISVRTAYNLSGCSFSPSALNDAIAEIKPGFKTVYNPDARQNIAASWPNSIDDSRARVDWGWEPKYDTKGLVSAMLEALSCTAH